MSAAEGHVVRAVWTGTDPWPRCASCGERVVLTTAGWKHYPTTERKAS